VPRARALRMAADPPERLSGLRGAKKFSFNKAPTPPKAKPDSTRKGRCFCVRTCVCALCVVYL
jgi:hypothetical protein